MADFMVPLALATQTGGSTIRPASFCGVYGMKPTFGRIGFEGAKHYSPHLDTIGLYGRSASDLSMMGEIFHLAAPDELQPCPVAGLRIGLCETPNWHLADADAKEALHEAGRRVAAAGASVTPLVLSEPFKLRRAEVICLRPRRVPKAMGGCPAFVETARVVFEAMESGHRQSS